MAAGPCRLEIEAAGDAVDVQAFAREVEAGDKAAFHGAEVDLLQADAAAGDELLLVGGFPLHGESSIGEFADQGVFLFLWELRPLDFLGNAGCLNKPLPQSARDFPWDAVLDKCFPRLGAEGGEGGAEIFRAGVAEPVDGNSEPVVLCLEVARLPCGKPEYGRTAEAAVGDEDGAGLRLAFRQRADGGGLDGEAGEPFDARVADVEGKQGGGQRLDAVAEGFDRGGERGCL